MAIDRYGLYPASIIDTAGVPVTTNFLQIGGAEIRPGAEKITIVPGGDVDPHAIIMNFADPRVMFSTDDLVTILPVVSLSAGKALSGATVRMQKRADGATFTSGSVHQTITATKGFLHITGINAQQDDEAGANMELELIALYDGTNLPLVLNSAQAISAVVPDYMSKFFMGPVYVNSTLIEGVVSTRVEPGIQFSAIRADGLTFAPVGSIIARRPRMTFRMLNTAYAATIGNLYNNALPGSVVFYYVRGVDGGSRVAYATTSHAKITGTAGSWSPEDISVQDTQDGFLNVSIMLTGTIAAATATAIP